MVEHQYSAFSLFIDVMIIYIDIRHNIKKRCEKLKMISAYVQNGKVK